MSTVIRGLAGVVGSAALVLAGMSTASARPAPEVNAATGSSRVVSHIGGGTTASSPYIVQVLFVRDGSWYGCTGEAISAEWIVTARHCTQGDDAMYIYFSNSTVDRGPAYRVDRLLNSPVNDVGLAHLRTPKSLSSYGKLTSGYTPKVGDTGTIWGYGHLTGGYDSPGLRKATVKVIGTGKDLYKDPTAIHTEGVTGSSNHGDSGGPLIINGAIVGLSSKGDPNDGGPGIHARSFWGSITTSRSWIKEQTGI